MQHSGKKKSIKWIVNTEVTIKKQALKQSPDYLFLTSTELSPPTFPQSLALAHFIAFHHAPPPASSSSPIPPSVYAGELSLQITAILPPDTFVNLRFPGERDSPGKMWTVVMGYGAGRNFINVSDLENEDFLHGLSSLGSHDEQNLSPLAAHSALSHLLSASASNSPSQNLPDAVSLNETLPSTPAASAVTSPPPAVLQAIQTLRESQAPILTRREGREPRHQGALSRSQVSARLLEMDTQLTTLQRIADQMERELAETKMSRRLHFPGSPVLEDRTGGFVMDDRSSPHPMMSLLPEQEASGWARVECRRSSGLMRECTLQYGAWILSPMSLPDILLRRLLDTDQCSGEL
ncbi:hypothetical protein JZ751_001673 [Albula glossodonta]|uniref:Uncharacterized protein n=1 Tax=Albula glossodonta TaxID=121402 RepID=A0A8T2PUC4_9TELE|nr:hypothetical protein JZ751_001673 [Albula glossodonta]